MTDADCADDWALLINTPAQAESLLYSLKQAAEGISFYIKANKTFMYFKQEGAISIFMWQDSNICKPFHILQQQ